MTRSIAQLVEAVVAARDDIAAIRSAAQLISIVEDAPERLPELIQAISRLAEASRPRHARLLLGVTGAPGSGKSTLVDAMVAECRTRFPERRVGVVAVDPSSPFTGGAVLGDRVRMMRHATDPKVFVRSMASRGHLGGLTLGVRGAIHVLGLLGCDVVFIETVGVGQSEVEIAGVADLVLLVLAPGQGDSVQLLKAGLMEIGDVFVVNKADKPEAAKVHAEVLAALELDKQVHAGEVDPLSAESGDGSQAGDALAFERGRCGRVEPRACLVSAQDKKGVVELVDAVEEIAAGVAGPSHEESGLAGRARDGFGRPAGRTSSGHRTVQAVACASG
ncbi:MAG: methylmalonyl Co-A mutase-associated GTPase MeaB [Planctomycetota bacterium]|nr:methylmalonyl Co-A mutase-associated GTPase MeaB [Planctomycetota bacterium]